MCGIWGIFPDNGKLTEKDLKLMDQIVSLTALRGRDSTGISVIAEGQKSRTVKMVGGPDFLLNSDAGRKLEEFAVKKGIAMFGHGRWGTMGQILAKNAHPHVVGHITLVHNGTIQYGLEKEMEEAKTDNDSLALCHAIVNKGLVDALDGVVGAFALIVHDSKENCVYFVRNSERPLNQLEWDGKRIVMSEDLALDYLVKRNTYRNFQPKITYFEQNCIYKLDLKTGGFTKDDSLKEKLAKKWKPPVVVGLTTQKPSGGDIIPTGRPTTRYFSVDQRLMLVSIEKHPVGDTWKYVFLTEDNDEVVGSSSYHVPERLGQVALTREIGLIKAFKGSPEMFWVRFRELRWEGEKKEEVKEEPKEETEVLPEQVRFRNGHTVSYKEAEQILHREDCALCQGPIAESELADTILTTNKTLICCDCIRQGRHFAFGFGQ